MTARLYLVRTTTGSSQQQQKDNQRNRQQQSNITSYARCGRRRRPSTQAHATRKNNAQNGYTTSFGTPRNPPPCPASPQTNPKRPRASSPPCSYICTRTDLPGEGAPQHGPTRSGHGWETCSSSRTPRSAARSSGVRIHQY